MVLTNRRKTIVRRIFIGTTVVIVIGLIVSWGVAGWLVSPQRLDVGDLPADLPGVSVKLNSNSGSTVSGWHINSPKPRGVIVLLHGIHSTRLSMLNRARLFSEKGYSIVMIDLQGHGESPGEQITLGHLESHDARAAVEFARDEHPNEPIGVVGVSLGGASAMLASPLEIDALVVESVFPDIRAAIHNRVSAKLGFLSFLPAEILLAQFRPRLGVSPSQIRPIDHIVDVGCPIFVLSGTDDLHTTASETRRMYDMASEPKKLWLVPGAAHIDLLDAAPEEYNDRVLTFFNEHLKNRDE